MKYNCKFDIDISDIHDDIYTISNRNGKIIFKDIIHSFNRYNVVETVGDNLSTLLGLESLCTKKIKEPIKDLVMLNDMYNNIDDITCMDPINLARLLNHPIITDEIFESIFGKDKECFDTFFVCFDKLGDIYMKNGEIVKFETFEEFCMYIDKLNTKGPRAIFTNTLCELLDSVMNLKLDEIFKIKITISDDGTLDNTQYTIDKYEDYTITDENKYYIDNGDWTPDMMKEIKHSIMFILAEDEDDNELLIKDIGDSISRGNKQFLSINKINFNHIDNSRYNYYLITNMIKIYDNVTKIIDDPTCAYFFENKEYSLGFEKFIDEDVLLYSNINELYKALEDTDKEYKYIYMAKFTKDDNIVKIVGKNLANKEEI